MTSSPFSGTSPAWMPGSACRGEDPELFFPVAAAGPALAQVFAAKAVCLGCAVRAACLSYALATAQAGIWGGTTQEERHVMRESSAFRTRKPRATADHRSNHPGL
jgi:WhiB family redox-sensing transcriptional regulator